MEEAQGACEAVEAMEVEGGSLEGSQTAVNNGGSGGSMEVEHASGQTGLTGESEVGEGHPQLRMSSPNDGNSVDEKCTTQGELHGRTTSRDVELCCNNILCVSHSGGS